PSRRSLTNASWPGIGTGAGGGDEVSARASRCRPTAARKPPTGSRGVTWLPPLLLQEIHLGRLGRPRRLQLEVRPRPLAEHLRRQHLREAPDVGVVAVHRFVVVLARNGDAVLRPLELV